MNAEVIDRARATAMMFDLARCEFDAWVTWPASVAGLMAAQVAAGVEKASGKPVMIEAGIMQRARESHACKQLDAVADLRIVLDG